MRKKGVKAQQIVYIALGFPPAKQTYAMVDFGFASYIPEYSPYAVQCSMAWMWLTLFLAHWMYGKAVVSEQRCEGGITIYRLTESNERHLLIQQKWWPS